MPELPRLLTIVVTAVFFTCGAATSLAVEGSTNNAASTGGKSGDGLPEFDSEKLLLLPDEYRQWVFVGSSFGLGYSDPGESKPPESFKHVYVNPFGYRLYKETGTFPVGTMFLLEIAKSGTKRPPQLQGSYASEFVGLEAAVKSGDRFDDPWTYYSFDGANGQRLPKARRFSGERCVSCHREHGETDHVFTQFYSVLKELQRDGARDGR